MGNKLLRWPLGATLSLLLLACAGAPSAEGSPRLTTATTDARSIPTAATASLAAEPTIAAPGPPPVVAPSASNRSTTTEPQESFDVRMFSPTNGWAFRRRASTLMAGGASSWTVLRTADGGDHWRDVSPPAVPRDARAGATFLDDKDAWLLLPSGTNGLLMLFRTTDAAATWQRSEVRTPYSTLAYGGGNLEFLDPLHAWLLVQQHTVGMLTGPAVLYRTADGGDTWTLISNTDSSTPGHLPFAGGLSFRTTLVGWLVGNGAGTGPGTLYATGDGGATWEPVRLPLPPTDQGELSLYGPPTLFPPSREDGLFTAQFIPADHDQAHFALLLYTSRNGGRSWSPRVLPYRGITTFVDVNDGWIWVPRSSNAQGDGALYRTRDGGKTWSAVPQASAGTGLLQSGGDVDHLEFVTSQVGWATVRPSGRQSTELLRTSDGGRTWTRIYGPNGS